MTDPVDIATENVENWLAAAEQEARGKSAPEQDARFDGKHCVEEDCSVDIPPARLALGRVRCVDCQTIHEKRNTLKRHNIKT